MFFHIPYLTSDAKKLIPPAIMLNIIGLRYGEGLSKDLIAVDDIDKLMAVTRNMSEAAYKDCLWYYRTMKKALS